MTFLPRMAGVSGFLRRKASAALAAAVPAATYFKEALAPADSIVNITFASAGGWSATDESSQTGTWKIGGGTGANYWVRWTNTSGTLSTGTAGTWQQLSSDRTFGVSVTSNSGGLKTTIGTVEFATDSGGANIIASGSITLTAQVTT